MYFQDIPPFQCVYTKIKKFGCFTQNRLKLRTHDGVSYNLRIRSGKPSCLHKLFWTKVYIDNSEVFVNLRSLSKRLGMTCRFTKHLLATRSKKLHKIIAICQKIGPFAKSLAEEEPLGLTENFKKSLLLIEEIESQKAFLSIQAIKGGFATKLIQQRHLLARYNPEKKCVDFFLSLKNPLGKGGFRTAYPLMDYQTSKVSLALSLQYPTKPSQVEQTKREYEFLKILESVKQVVRPFFFYKTKDALYLVTKRCSGSFDKIIENSKISLKKKLELFREVVKGVNKIHDHSIIHRDIKPQNILYTKDHKIKIIDFNLSCLNSETSRLTPFCGTAPYQPPEVILRKIKEEPEKIDSFSLGVILYKICEKQSPPFAHLFHKQAHLPTIERQEAKLLKAVNNLPFRRLKKGDPLIPIIKGLLNPDPKLRLSAKELASLI